MIKAKLVKKKTKLRLKDYVHLMDDMAIYVFPPDEPHPNSDTGESIAKIGFWNEYGTKRIHSRPFLRPAIRENKDKYKRILMKLAKALLLKKRDLYFCHTYLGLTVVQDVQHKIDSIIMPENSDYTIARKGSSKPLIDTGILRGSITYKPVKQL